MRVFGLPLPLIVGLAFNLAGLGLNIAYNRKLRRAGAAPDGQIHRPRCYDRTAG
jgi:hypothetical protein